MNRLQAKMAQDFSDVLIDFAKAIKSEDYTDTRLFNLMNPIFSGFTSALLCDNKNDMELYLNRGLDLIEELDGEDE